MLRLVLGGLMVAWSSLALAQEDPVRGALAGWGCEPVEVLPVGERWYAACGAQGVFVVEQREGKLELAERRRVPGSARAVYTRDNLVWVESTHVEARPLIDLAIEGAVPVPPPVVAAPPPAAHPPTLPPPELHPIEPPPPESKLWPSRKGGLLVIEGSVRPLLPIDTRAFAALAEVSVGYIGARNWFVQARGFPLGGIVGEGRDVPLMGALAQAGYDHSFFSIGVGAGALTRGSWDYRYDYEAQRSYERTEQSTHFALSQYARLGARDGLNLSMQSVFVLVDDWKFGFIEVRGQIPIVRGTWITPAGGGGSQSGFYYGEVGLRRMLRGDRGSGSLFLRPSVGIAGVDKRDRYDSVRIGPMIGVHVEWRK